MAGRMHTKECASDRCAPGCSIFAFELALDAPVTAGDAKAAAVRQDRADALLRGEIPT